MSTSQIISYLDESPAPADADLRRGSMLGSRYRIERVLATGGMATIYAARDMTLDRETAVKVLRPEAGPMSELVERFLNEARALAKLRGPRTTRVFDYGRTRQPSGREVTFIVLELLDGVDLFTALQQNHRLGAPLTARYIIEACEGLAEAHALGIIHRDIKPENLFLAREVDGTVGIKLIDFGVSKSTDRSGPIHVTEAHDVVGSPLYMSPEQMRAMPVDVRTDIWGLGAVMFECLAGRPAFAAATVYEVCAQVLNAPIPDLSRLNPELPDALVRVVNLCLQREPSDRYQNVTELARALQPFAAPTTRSTLDRIEHLLGVQPCEPADEEALDLDLEVDPIEDELTKRDIPGLKSHWRLWPLVTLPTVLFVAYLGFTASGGRYLDELTMLLARAWHQAVSLFAVISR